MPPNDLLSLLNTPQFEAITNQGPPLILASPGSGKTLVLTEDELRKPRSF